jgi:hypothetical protein
MAVIYYQPWFYFTSCHFFYCRRPRSDVEVLVDDMVAREPLISDNRKPQLRRLIYKLIEKLETNEV